MKKLKVVAALLAGLIATAAFATPETDAVLATLHQKYPNTNFTSVDTTPLPGVYELVMGHNIAYSDKDGHYFLFGNLYDMQERQDLTAPKRDALNRVDVSKIPMKDAIVRVQGKGERKLYIFTDPDCPFCKKLEVETLPKLDNVTIYVFMFPITQLHPHAAEHSQDIWCLPEKDRAAAWTNALTKNEIPPTATCANPIDELAKIGADFGIHGTPTLISADGRMLPGAVDVQRLDAWLNQTNQHPATASAGTAASATTSK